MRAWLRRNRIGLVAFVVLLPLTIGVTGAHEWSSYFAERPVQLQTVRSGATVTYARATYTVTAANRIAATSDAGRKLALPSGTDLIVATLAIDPTKLDADGASNGCLIELHELDGDTVERSWTTSNATGIDYVRPADVAYGCDSSLTTGYTAEVTFLVPSGVGGGSRDLALLLYSADALPRAIQLRL